MGDFLKALDLNVLLRKAATVSTPTMTIAEEGGVWNIKTATTLKSIDLKFKLGEEMDETTAGGREVKSLCTFENGKIVTVQTAKNPKHKSTKTIRELNGPDELFYTMTVEGIDDLVCVQKFKRVA